MAKRKVFNITGPCVPALHYMVDTSKKIDEIINEWGHWFESSTDHSAGSLEKSGFPAFCPCTHLDIGKTAAIAVTSRRNGSVVCQQSYTNACFDVSMGERPA